MRLVDLEPRWATLYGHGLRSSEPFQMGMSFLCPHCREERLWVPFKNPIGQLTPEEAVHYKPTGHLWQRTGETFEELSLSPSVDASAYGHWHGWITNGEIR